ncbi:MAG: ribonuclease T [Gammaproteobacteria bacterium]|nr:ribonuclease T [Gammaproteobacteria bacterium]
MNSSLFEDDENDAPLNNDNSNQDGEFRRCLASRFRGFLPVVVDIESDGFDAKKDALLEIAAVLLRMDLDGNLHREETIACHLQPFPGANLDPKALKFIGVDPYNPFRMAKAEKDALDHICKPIAAAVKAEKCTRAILVGHNAFFDLGFMNAAMERNKYKKNPFHKFSSFDTASLAGVAYGQTVLARAAAAAGLAWDNSRAHSAIYDAEMTAELFCRIVNRWNSVSGFPVPMR